MQALKKIGIGLAIAGLVLFFLYLAISKKDKGLDRSEILEKAREAKLAKSLAKNSESTAGETSENQPTNE
jgi:hypothetical protein